MKSKSSLRIIALIYFIQNMFPYSYIQKYSITFDDLQMQLNRSKSIRSKDNLIPNQLINYSPHPQYDRPLSSHQHWVSQPVTLHNSTQLYALAICTTPTIRSMRHRETGVGCNSSVTTTSGSIFLCCCLAHMLPLILMASQTLLVHFQIAISLSTRASQ